MLELIVCGNIVGLDIPIRVVQHELWRPHILETTADDYSSDCEAEVCASERPSVCPPLRACCGRTWLSNAGAHLTPTGVVWCGVVQCNAVFFMYVRDRRRCRP